MSASYHREPVFPAGQSHQPLIKPHSISDALEEADYLFIWGAFPKSPPK